MVVGSHTTRPSTRERMFTSAHFHVIHAGERLHFSSVNVEIESNYRPWRDRGRVVRTR